MNKTIILNKNKRSKKRPKTFSQSILEWDKFQEPFKFQLPNGSDSLSSFPGLCFTAVMAIIAIAYGGNGLIDLFARGDSHVTFYTIDSYFPPDY